MKICALILALASAALAGEKATVHAPDDLQPNEILPVLLVEQGIADSYAKLWPVLSKRMRLIVVETAPLRTMLKLPDARTRIDAAMIDALREALTRHNINRCPRVVLAFSAAAPHMGYAALSRPRLYQGLLLVNSAMRTRDLPPNLEAARTMPVAILHSSRDPGVPAQHATSVQLALKERGIDASLEIIDSGQHNAPLGEPGAPAIEKFLKGLGTKPVEGREIPVAPGDRVRRLHAHETTTGVRHIPVPRIAGRCGEL